MFKHKTTVSLLHHDYIVNALEADAIRQEVETILAAFNKGEFEKITRLEELVEETFTLIKENIQSYNKEHVRLEHLERIITRFFHSHLFDVVEDEVLEQVRVQFQEQLRDVLSNLNKLEVKHGKHPASTYFRKLLKENQKLDKQALADTRRLLNLHTDENETREHLYNLLMVLIRERGLQTSSLERYEEKLSKAIDHFIIIVAQEFRALYDVKVDASLEEADLIKEIDVILSHKISQDHRKRLKELRKKIDVFVRKDINKFKKQVVKEKIAN